MNIALKTQILIHNDKKIVFSKSIKNKKYNKIIPIASKLSKRVA